MKLSKYIDILRTLVFAAMSVFILASVNATADEVSDSGYQELSEGANYTGTVNIVHPEQALIIIDDRPFILDRVIQFNNAAWSREQVLNQLQPDSRVEIELGRIVDTDSNSWLVTKLRTLGK